MPPDLRVGIDVGGTKCLGVSIEGDPGRWRVVGTERRTTPAPPDLVGVLVDIVGHLDPGAASVVVGVGVPGLVDVDGRLRFAPNLGGAVDLAVGDELETALGRRAIVDNDANAAAWAEALVGAGRGRDEVMVVTLGTGIGGGVVTGGRLLRGDHGFAGEIGHVTIQAGGVACACGRSGCWEQYASGTALARMAAELMAAGRLAAVASLAAGGEVRGEQVAQAAAAGDREACDLVAETGRWVGLGLASLVAVFDPGVIVVGGGLLDLGDLLLEPARVTLEEELLGRGARVAPPVVAAELGERAGAIGAAFLGV